MGKVRDIFTKNEKVFIPYLMAGDPNPSLSIELLLECQKQGAHAVELGVPFSDPMADGVVNQRAAERALAQGVSLLHVFQIVKDARERGLEIPIILFSYFNPLFKFGLERMAYLAQEAGIDGVLVVDLPFEEASEFLHILKEHQLDSILLASPATPPERIKLLSEASTGFLYYVSINGVTGARSQLPEDLKLRLQEVREISSAPVAAGFGISSGEMAREVSQYAHGVIVGSALVKQLEGEEGFGNFSRLLKELTNSLHS